MRARAADQLVSRVFEGAVSSIGSVRGDRVDCVGYGEDSGAEADITSLEMVWIAAAVVALVVLRDDLRRAFQEIYSAKYLRAVFHMPAHVSPFILSERAPFQ